MPDLLHICRSTIPPARKTALVMQALGFPSKAITATLGTHPLICAVPGCDRMLCEENHTGVCRWHNHFPGYCGCFGCEIKIAERAG